MDDERQAQHRERMAAYAADIAGAQAGQATAQADQARTALRHRELDDAQASSKRMERAFEALSMEHAVRRAALDSAFADWPIWAQNSLNNQR